MQQRNPDEISLRDAVGFVRRHRLLILGAIVLCTGVAAAWALTATPTYEATSTIRVQTPAARLPEIFQTELERDEVRTEMEELRSRGIAEHVARSVGLQLEMIEPTSGPRVVSDITVEPDVAEAEYTLERTSDNEFVPAGDESPVRVAEGRRVTVPGATFTLTPAASRHATIRIRVRPLADVVKDLRQQVQISRSNDEVQIITLRYRHPVPELADATLTAWAERYMDAKSEAQKTEARSLIAFLRVQLDTLTAELTAAENELREFREREQVVNPEAESETGVEMLAEMRAERNGIDAERRALAGLLQELGSTPDSSASDVSAYRRLIAFPSLLEAQATSELLRSLASVEEEEVDLLRRRTREDPEVQVLAERRRALENRLGQVAETYLAGLTQQVAALDGALAESGQRLATLPAREVEYARLRRAPEVLSGMVTLIQTRLKEAQIAEAVDQPGSRIVDAAWVARDPVAPRPALNLAAGLLAGLALGLAGAALREFVDRSMHTRHEVEALTGAPVLGVIPRLELPGSQLPILAAESYGRLYVNVAALRREAVPRTLLITSPLAGEGKTTTAMNLAASLVERGYRALLIDADLRRGVVHQLMGLNRSPGLTDVLEGRATFEQALRTTESSGVELACVTAGARSATPFALLRSAGLRNLLERAAQQFDAVILDSPPVNLVSDAAVLAELVDGVMLVARAGSTGEEALDFAVRQLRLVNAPILGTVLNDIDPRRDVGYDGTYRYLGFDEYYSYSGNG
jgi:capsular exopolysaccharide synthesis family protein